MNDDGIDKPMAGDDATPTNAMVERAQQTAADPNASQDDIIGAASLLVACGVFESARAALGRIDPDGPLKAEAGRLRQTIGSFSNAPSGYTDGLLANAIAIARSPTSTDQQLLIAADNLVRWGSLDEADHALQRLQNAVGLKGKAARLAAASRQLRRSGILSDLAQLGDNESAILTRPQEIMVAKREGARRAVIVFTGRGKRMWVTLSVFHQFLRRYDAHIFYLRDNSERGYLNGLQDSGGGFHNLVATLDQRVAELGAKDIHIMANSAGGFAGLMTALELKAKSFLGFGIRTDLSTMTGRQAVAAWTRDQRLLINLRSLIEKAESPPRIILYCGELNALDRAEAENLRGAPNVEIHVVEGDDGHDTIAALLIRGEFEKALKRFLLDEPS